MDEEHRIVAAERYESLVAHVFKHHKVSVRIVSEGTPNVDNIDFDLIEVHCYNCDWWDHWDERKGDIIPA